MSAGAEWPVLEKSALFDRLAQGRTAGFTVVTPNQRLSQALMLEFDAFQIGKALSVWEAPDILPFGAFVQRLYEEGLYTDLPAELPMLLSPAQEEELWRQVVGGSGLLAVEGAAARRSKASQPALLFRRRPFAFVEGAAEMRERADLRDDHGVDGFHPEGTISHTAKSKSLTYQFY